MADLLPVDYAIDGIRMTGRLAQPGNPVSAPGVLVAPEAPGITENALLRAAMLAELGYVALVADLYGDDNIPGDSAARHAAIMAKPGAMERRARAALDTLGAWPGVDSARLGAVGFCQGGITVMELARSGAPIACAIGFHPGLQRPAASRDGPVLAKVLMFVGDDDPVAPRADREAFAAEMQSAGADWQLHILGGVGHSFTNKDAASIGRPGFAYDERATLRSWRSMRDLLEEAIGD